MVSKKLNRGYYYKTIHFIGVIYQIYELLLKCTNSIKALLYLFTLISFFLMLAIVGKYEEVYF